MTAYTIFGQTGGGVIQNDNGKYTMGMQFTVSSTVSLTGIWWYSAATATVLPSECAIFLMTGAGVGSKVAGTDNASPTWSGIAGSGWVKCTYPGTTNLTSGNTYKVSIQLSAAATFQYSATAAYWTSGPGGSGITNGPLHAVNNAGGDGGQDTFKVTSTMAYPTTSSGANNYWVDVEVTGPTAHTATASLAVTPALADTRHEAAGRHAALAVTPVLAASRVRGRFRTAALNVAAALAAHAGAAFPHLTTAVLNVTPVLHATKIRAGNRQAALAVNPRMLAVVTGGQVTAKSTSAVVQTSTGTAGVLQAVTARAGVT